MREMWPWILGVVAVVGVFAVIVMGAGKRDSAEAHRLVEGGALLVDVRTPGEFAAGHLDGAVNIPVDQLKARLRELPDKQRPVVVYCRSGARSAAAAGTLKAAGYAQVEDLGAMRNW
ncbi:MAG: rhodanese-like domain-containing protein [Myxococcota bacterium]